MTKTWWLLLRNGEVFGGASSYNEALTKMEKYIMRFQPLTFSLARENEWTSVDETMSIIEVRRVNS